LLKFGEIAEKGIMQAGMKYFSKKIINANLIASILKFRQQVCPINKK